MWPFHRHKMEVVDVGYYEYALFGGGHVTKVTTRCRCTKVKTKDYEGMIPKHVFFDK